MTGGIVGGAFAAGLVLMVFGFRTVRRPNPADRILPHIRDISSVGGKQFGTRAAWIMPKFVRDLRESVGELVSSTNSVERRLDQLGDGRTVADFRAQQWSYGIGGLAAGLLGSLALWSRGTVPVAVGLLVCGIAFLAGLMLCDQRLSAKVRARHEQMSAEFPIIADLLALSVAAGESPVQALERVVAVGRGALTEELARVLADIHAGSTVIAALESLSQRTGVLSVARFASSLVVSIERGTPLTEVVNAQAADVREARRRALIETAGRREILMLVPVVFLILPLVVVFAFFPGLAGLQFVSGS